MNESNQSNYYLIRFIEVTKAELLSFFTFKGVHNTLLKSV